MQHMNNVDRAFNWNPRILRSLQYFEAVARLGTVAAAAEEIGVSASAVSHQLRSLSNFVGEDLFVRAGRGLALTDRGVRLQLQVASAFSELASALSDSVGEKKARLRIAVCSSFGPHWLASRLPDFLRRNPTIDVELRLYCRDPEQTESVADAIVTALPVVAGFESVSLFEEILVAVGTSGVTLDGASAMPRLITTDIPPARVGEDWQAFFALTDRATENLDDEQFVRCSHYMLAIALAKAGLGAALVPDFVLEDSQVSAGLTVLDSAKVPTGRIYQLCYKQSRAMEPDLQSLAVWLTSVCHQGT